MSVVEEKYGENTDGRMLFDAIRKGKQHLVRFILEASPGNIVNARDFNGKTPLIVVSSIKEEFRRSSVTRSLLFHGANVNLPDDHGRTPLSYACEKRCNDLVEIFVKQRNIDPDLVDDGGNSPLMYCTMVGNDTATNILVRYFRRLGLKVDCVNKEGYTPLLMAAKNGYISCARILFQQGQASLVARDPVTNRTVEELLEKNGFTVEDLLPFTKQLEAKRRFQKMIHIARFTKSWTSNRYDTGKNNDRGPIHRASISIGSDILENNVLPYSHRAHFRSVCSMQLPPVKSTCHTKCNHTGKKPLNRSTSLSKAKGVIPAIGSHLGVAVIPAICNKPDENVKEFHTVGTQACHLEGRMSAKSDKSENSTTTDEEEFSDKESEYQSSDSEDTIDDAI